MNLKQTGGSRLHAGQSVSADGAPKPVVRAKRISPVLPSPVGSPETVLCLDGVKCVFLFGTVLLKLLRRERQMFLGNPNLRVTVTECTLCS